MSCWNRSWNSCTNSLATCIKRFTVRTSSWKEIICTLSRGSQLSEKNMDYTKIRYEALLYSVSLPYWTVNAFCALSGKGRVSRSESRSTKKRRRKMKWRRIGSWTSLSLFLSSLSFFFLSLSQTTRKSGSCPFYLTCVAAFHQTLVTIRLTCNSKVKQ